MPELGSTRLLAQLVGLGNAADMCLTGRMVTADEALRMGLVIKVVEPDNLLDAAIEKATEIANNPPQAVMFVKELLRQNPLRSDIDRVTEREGIRDQIARRHPESRRGAGSVHGEAGTEIREVVTGFDVAHLQKPHASTKHIIFRGIIDDSSF